MATSTVRVTRGKAKHFEKMAESGSIATREFCGRCGAPLFASSSARLEFIGIKAASLDDPNWFRAEADVWIGSAQPWDCLDPAIPKFQKNRPRAGPQ